MSYDPRAHGADCHRCYLYNRREGGPVPPEINPGATAMIVAEAPGRTECEWGRPLIGDTGQELQRAVSAMGYRRTDFSYSNALLCRPPGNELSILIHNWKEENKLRKKTYGPNSLMPSPMECCRPRLLRELTDFDNIITLGSTPIQSLLGTTQYSISALRGGPIDAFVSEKGFETDEAFTLDQTGHVDPMWRKVKVLPTFHPSFVLHKRKWTKTLRTDLGRAMRWFQGKLRWQDPEILLHPSVKLIEEFIAAPTRWNSWDLETTMDGPLDAQIFCFGIGRRDASGQRSALVIPFHSKEAGTIEGAWGHPSFYNTDEFEEIVSILRRWAVNPKRWKIGHNSLVFDSQVVKSRFGVMPFPQHDTLVLHRAAESELPHTLGFVGTTYTDVTAWKADKTGTEAKTDKELHLYNGIDCVVTDDVVEPLVEAVKLRDQSEVVRRDYKFLQACLGMHRLGMRVNPERRDHYDKYFLYEAVKWRNIIRQIVNIASFNPGSVEQVKDILFDRWGLPPVAVSETTGAPSTDDDSLRTYRISFNLTRQQRQFVEALRKYRNATKMRGTDVVKYRPFNESMPPDDFWEDTEETPEEYAYRRKKDLKKMGILRADGRVHASWNQLTTSGRGNCVAKGTFIEVVRDVAAAPRGVPIEQVRRGDLVYGFDVKGRLKIRPVMRAFKTGTRDVIRVHWLGQGRTKRGHVDLTPDHRVRRASGGWCRAGDLKPGDCVAALSRGRTHGYARLWATGHPEILEHRFVYQQVHGHVVPDVHHENENKLDNRPKNLVAVDEGEHHSEHNLVPDATLREARSARALAAWAAGKLKGRSGAANSNHRPLTKQQIAKALKANGYAITKAARAIGMDFDCFKQHVRDAGFDLTQLKRRHIRLKYNHVVTKVEPLLGHVDVYDLEVQDIHTFIANEVCVHNCTDPNLQNKRRKYRDMYEPEPDCKYCKEPHVYVAADMDQLELRFSANRWGLKRYVEALLTGRDPHAETAIAAMGDEARASLAKAEAWAKEQAGRKAKDQDDWKRFRDFAKRFYYAIQYAAEDLTVYDVLTSVEDDDGNLIYADLDMQTVRERRANLLDMNPEFKTGWEWEVVTWRRQGFLCEPVWGRRRDFLNGEELNEIVNFPIQGGGRAVVMNALFAALEVIPFEKWCPYTGLVHDGHDSEMFEVPLSKGEWAKNVLQECMRQRVEGHTVPYTAEAKVGVNKDKDKGPVGRRSWADV